MFDSALWAFFKFVTVIVPLIVGKAGTVIVAPTSFNVYTDGFALQLAVFSAALGLGYFFASEYTHGKLHIKVSACLGLIICFAAMMFAFIDLAQKNSLSIINPGWGYKLYSILIFFPCSLIFIEMIWQFLSEIVNESNQEKLNRNTEETDRAHPEYGQSLIAAGKSGL